MQIIIILFEGISLWQTCSITHSEPYFMLYNGVVFVLQILQEMIFFLF